MVTERLIKMIEQDSKWINAINRPRRFPKGLLQHRVSLDCGDLFPRPPSPLKASIQEHCPSQPEFRSIREADEVTDQVSNQPPSA